MRADDGFAVLHKDDLLHLGEVVQPVRDQEDDLVARVGLEIGEYRVLRRAVERGERIVQHENGARMRERARKRQSLRLTAREPHTAAGVASGA